MKDLVLAADFLGFQPYLTINNQKTYSTSFSTFLSIMVIILSILSTIYFGWDLVFKTEPTVLIGNKDYTDFGPVNMSSTGFNFIFSVKHHDYTSIVDPSIFEVSASYLIKKNEMVNGVLSEISEYRNVSVDVCSKFYEDEDILEKNRKFELGLYYCLKPDEVTINGFWGTNSYSTVFVYINKCVNSTQNGNTCKSQDLIDQAIQNGFISFEMTGYSINQANYNQPITRQFDNNYNLLNVNSSIFYAYHLYPITFQSDNGFLLKENINYEGIISKHRIFNVISKSDNIVTFSFEGFSSGPVYIRSYIKVQTVMTQIGGFINIIMIIAKFISFFVTKNYFFISYLSENNIKYDSYNLDGSIAPLVLSENPREVNSGKIKINSLVLKEKEIIKSNKIMASTFSYMCSEILFCRKKIVKNKLIQNFKNLFEKTIGVEYMFKSFVEMENIKTQYYLKIRKEINPEHEFKRFIQNKIKT